MTSRKVERTMLTSPNTTVFPAAVHAKCPLKVRVNLPPRTIVNGLNMESLALVCREWSTAHLHCERVVAARVEAKLGIIVHVAGGRVINVGGAKEFHLRTDNLVERQWMQTSQRRSQLEPPLLHLPHSLSVPVRRCILAWCCRRSWSCMPRLVLGTRMSVSTRKKELSIFKTAICAFKRHGEEELTKKKQHKGQMNEFHVARKGRDVRAVLRSARSSHWLTAAEQQHNRADGACVEQQQQRLRNAAVRRLVGGAGTQFEGGNRTI
eukprot:2888489-Rhodomonas_salina.2